MFPPNVLVFFFSNTDHVQCKHVIEEGMSILTTSAVTISTLVCLISEETGASKLISTMRFLLFYKTGRFTWTLYKSLHRTFVSTNHLYWHHWNWSLAAHSYLFILWNQKWKILHNEAWRAMLKKLFWIIPNWSLEVVQLRWPLANGNEKNCA